MILKTDLYQHQINAVEKLRQIKVGALYLEMGTGKTRTALELIKLRLATNKIDHVLWLCPCSVKENLRRDLLKHCDDISMITICGIETLSSSIKVNSELLHIVQNSNTYLIVDESNLVKNHMTYRTKNIIRLSEQCKYKLILNGTPISKNEKDLFAQWYILDWRILGYQSFWSFAANHLEYDPIIPGKIYKCLNTDYLVRKIAPYTYQIRKSECLDLPEKTYDVVYYDITKEQDEHYEQIANELMFNLNEFVPETIYRLFTGLQNVISGFRVKTGEHLSKEPFFKNPLDNPRIETLLDILNDISEKVIIFCKYTYEIEIVTKILKEQYGEGTAVPFYGELNQKQRQKNLDSFLTTARFLVANKICAGYGLNLQYCSYIIYYSNDWDYATRAQSEDRVHRIGQQFNVNIIDICASYTLDERILKCLWRKEDLIDSFRKEIDRTKDKTDIESWIYKKDSYRRNYSKKMKNLNKEDLLEMLIFKGNYDKQKFYSLMGKFFAERNYRKLMPYLVNDTDTTWYVEIENNEALAFISYTEKNNKIHIGYCYSEDNAKLLEKNLLSSLCNEFATRDIYAEIEKTFDKSHYLQLGFEIYKDTTNYLYLVKKVQK